MSAIDNAYHATADDLMPPGATGILISKPVNVLHLSRFTLGAHIDENKNKNDILSTSAVPAANCNGSSSAAATSLAALLSLEVMAALVRGKEGQFMIVYQSFCFIGLLLGVSWNPFALGTQV